MSKSYGYVKGRLSQRLQDPSLVNYTDADRIKAVNTAILAVIAARPDACQLLLWFAMTANDTFQSIPENAGDVSAQPNRLFDIVQFRSGGGTTKGGARRVERGSLDAFHPNWRSDSGGFPREWFFDDRSPLAYHVYPAPSASGHEALCRYSFTPAQIDSDDDLIGIQDAYIPALEEYILYLLWGGDRETSPNYVRAQGALQAFARIMEMKAQSDGATSPKVGLQNR